ncbi:hydroxyphenylacetyl-CoA thioesterase PaaI [Panacibacter ginsenosidivorans]|uniref:Hydroxyphenylacetyl-CoA thioesterase PaaI n=1 Tax=Panacibacter ginsenosidivorans TaxID=1813871 RepID=A0A5B8VDS8_9BACT|nr:hydroxyphenylacetyl-CoA thioesterase PaaI [Panacibacter ginsenosidivorans]QEC68438.1 hydroxyphenylacetyl-CoA thioesterase PaaI [Panacibacter ginsenosidivorans]
MTDKDVLANKVAVRLIETDHFSNWMGVKILDVKEGYSKIEMTLRREMLNGFGIAHGGITFAFADSAFAFACNSDGKVTVALDVSISFPKAGKEGDVLTAEAKLINKTNRTGLYMIEVRNQNNDLVALFKGTCYKTEKSLL